MNIVVLNGSPKGDLSITLQYVRFIQKKFPQHEFKIFHISQEIGQIERDEKKFQSIIDEIAKADGVLWAFPVYIFLVPSQYKRFIELIWERDKTDLFENKYTAILSTSIHFYDHTAHNYMNGVCDDLKMRHIGTFSADMYDLLEEAERARLLFFAKDFFEAINNGRMTSRRFSSLVYRKTNYMPGHTGEKIDMGNRKIILLTDRHDVNTNLGKMIEKLKELLTNKIEIIDLNELDIKGGCKGCLQCTLDNVCIYDETDGFTKFYKSKLIPADIIIFAGTIKDRYLSSRWKLFFDRTFFNTHIPTLIGKQIGFMISGPFNQIPNLSEIFEAHIALHRSNLVDFITDEYEDSSEIDKLLQSFVKRLSSYSKDSYLKSSTFLNIAGMRIFRDYIWGRLRFVLQADDRYYRHHGMYDFPQKNIRERMFNVAMIWITKIPSIRKEFRKKIKEGMVKPHKKVLEKI